MDDLLTYTVLLLMVYAGLKRVGLLRFSVMDIVNAIPWTPPQAAARQQAKQQRAQQQPVSIVPEHDRDSDYIMLRRSVHVAMMERRAKQAFARGEKTRETGKEYGIEQATRDLMQEAARKELSAIAEKALQRYAREGAIKTDTDVYALLGVRTKVGQERLTAIRAEIEQARINAALAVAASTPREYDQKPAGVLEDLPNDVLTFTTATASG